MSRGRTVVLALGLLASTGCYRHYEIRMSPHEEGFRRELRVTRFSRGARGEKSHSEVSAEEVARLRQAYRAKGGRVGQAYVFGGKFGATTPDDVGGTGAWVRMACPLGTLFVYRERFRGESDPDLGVDRRRRAADRIADLLGAWLAERFAKTEWEEKVGALAKGDLRTTLRGIAHLNASPSFEELFPRTEAFLVERGWLGASASLLSQTPIVVLRGKFPDLPREKISWARMLARRLGVPDGADLPQAFEFLTTHENSAKAWKEFAESSPVHARIRSERVDEIVKEGDTERSVGLDARDLLRDLVFDDLFGLSLGADGDRESLEVSLACPAEPHATNGAWDETTREVRWKTESLPPRERGLGLACMARWSVPDHEAQTKRFGRVALLGPALDEYVRERESLTAVDRAAWDAKIDRMDPTTDLPLAAFRPPPEGGHDPCAELRRLLARALEPPEVKEK